MTARPVLSYGCSRTLFPCVVVLMFLSQVVWAGSEPSTLLTPQAPAQAALFDRGVTRFAQNTELRSDASTPGEFELPREPSDLDVLDANGDGVIAPFEALDVLLMLEAELGKAPSAMDLDALALALKADQEAFVSELLGEFDVDGDGQISLTKLDEDARDFMAAFDGDENGVVTIEELRASDYSVLLASEEEIQQRLDELMAENDKNSDGRIDLSLPEPDGSLDNFREWDWDRNGVVSRDEIYRFMKADNTPVEFTVEGNTAYMTGVITNALPAAVLQLLFEHPEVDTIEMMIVPGSIDDVANLRAAMYVHRAGIATRLNARSSIASGGTDFFLAGVRRSVAPGATIGVHSWGGAGMDGADVPEDDPEHQKYIDYYIAVGIPQEFYWYTMRAAPANDIHLMTEEEIVRYQVRTTP